MIENITPIHPDYGLEIHDIQIKDISADCGYTEIRALFESHSILLFRNQEIDDEAHLKFGELFGSREDRTLDKNKPDPKISMVSNVEKDDSILSEGDKRLLNLQSNMLWHTDSTFLPVPALANILIGRVIPESGTTTEFLSSRMAWQEMPMALKDKVRDLYFIHDYSHSRAKIDPELAQQKMFTHWGQQIWKSVWTNPVNGKEALYIASHVCGIKGMDQDQALDLVEQLMAWCTQEKYVYAHQWQVGDVLIWDERAMLHRAVPWDYNQARTLSSICISTTTADGLEDMQYHSNSSTDPSALIG